MRKQRCASVQNEAQYIFIFTTALDYIRVKLPNYATADKDAAQRPSELLLTEFLYSLSDIQIEYTDQSVNYYKNQIRKQLSSSHQLEEMGEAEAINHEGKEDTRPRDALEGEVLKDVENSIWRSFQHGD
ncbi:unnamed protein product [Toxocara canis]|uniref:USP domain-containing protein n=1 Tax=Toxocara canis TaxID=6265 RepID=A0A183U0Q0_TOXCA|nr:unnamed protein product [Toxocara canis]